MQEHIFAIFVGNLQDAPLTNDVAMDDRGLIYFTDKACGLDVIEFQG